ncbi:PEST proteolytic signal-containing nuclear protein-like isoform X2 [Homarus americanus]|uniref:PEST proteolytic signal-containing nuclear protein-like isoform X2 n=1 Tax=Homarus americanus TaxID=6706 RepID=UPI001C4496D3|nr:PEST proteolytic signal-containing nuclear protein-like isoform X2 [Homarus americanus]
MQRCLSPETSLEERSTATKRPAADGEGGEEEPKKKISFGLGKLQERGSVGISLSTKKAVGGISIKLGQTQQKPANQTGVLTVKPKVGSAASVFGGEEDEDDQEEMPPEAKMRMKNIGRDTPTSAGPNSFGKTRMGFCDSKKIYEKQLKDVQDKPNKLEQDGL